MIRNNQLRPHILFVTGQLAESAVRSYVQAVADRVGFDLFDRSVADHRGCIDDFEVAAAQAASARECDARDRARLSRIRH